MNKITLVVNQILGRLNPEEEKKFNSWLAASQENRDFYNHLKLLEKQGKDISEISEIDVDAAWLKVLAKAQMHKRSTRTRKIPKTVLAYAAVFIGVLIITGYVISTTYFTNEGSATEKFVTLETPDGVIKVSRSKESTKQQILAGNVVHTNEQIDYTRATTESSISQHKLIVPYGKRFELLLQDSTLVYLNAGSSISYPSSFASASSRIVTLTGEAFFKVSKNAKKPFKVLVDDMTIQVYGTQFNVSAYPEDKRIKTVLTEGSIGLFLKDNAYEQQEIAMLKPNQKADWLRDSDNFDIQNVDTALYTDWMNGRLSVKNLPFSQISKKLERHYDVKIINNYKALDEMVFTASFDIESITEVLETFKEDTPFITEMKENTIIINPPKKTGI